MFTTFDQFRCPCFLAVHLFLSPCKLFCEKLTVTLLTRVYILGLIMYSHSPEWLSSYPLLLLSAAWAQWYWLPVHSDAGPSPSSPPLSSLKTTETESQSSHLLNSLSIWLNSHRYTDISLRLYLCQYIWQFWSMLIISIHTFKKKDPMYNIMCSDGDTYQYSTCCFLVLIRTFVFKFSKFRIMSS